MRQQIFSLVDSLPRTTNGSILITIYIRGVASFLTGKEVIILKTILPDEAAEIFKNELETPDLILDRTLLLTLLERLAYLPLVIVQAVSYINII